MPRMPLHNMDNDDTQSQKFNHILHICTQNICEFLEYTDILALRRVSAATKAAVDQSKPYPVNQPLQFHTRMLDHAKNLNIFQFNDITLHNYSHYQQGQFVETLRKNEPEACTFLQQLTTLNVGKWRFDVDFPPNLKKLSLTTVPSYWPARPFPATLKELHWHLELQSEFVAGAAGNVRQVTDDDYTTVASKINEMLSSSSIESFTMYVGTPGFELNVPLVFPPTLKHLKLNRLSCPKINHLPQLETAFVEYKSHAAAGGKLEFPVSLKKLGFFGIQRDNQGAAMPADGNSFPETLEELTIRPAPSVCDFSHFSQLKSLSLGAAQEAVTVKAWPPNLEELVIQHLNQLTMPALPKGLKKLVFEDVKSPNACTLSLPEDLQEICIDLGATATTSAPLVLPTKCLRRCTIKGCGFNEVLDTLTAAKGLEFLDISSCAFNQKVDDLPSTLRELTICSEHFNQSLSNLPRNLRNLTIDGVYCTHCEGSERYRHSVFNQPLQDLPESLVSLDMTSSAYDGSNDDHALCKLPAGLEYLSLQAQELAPICDLPNGLRTLSLMTTDTERKLHIVQLPDSIRHLYLAAEHAIIDCILPDELRRLCFRARGFLEVIRRSEKPLPKSLAQLSVEFCESKSAMIDDLGTLLPQDLVSLTLDATGSTGRVVISSLPQSLKSLFLFNVKLSDLSLLPDGLQSFMYDGGPREVLYNLPSQLHELSTTGSLGGPERRVSQLPPNLLILDAESGVHLDESVSTSGMFRM